MKVAIVGFGYWGPNLVRNFAATEGVTDVHCFELNPVRRKLIARRFPAVKIHDSFEDVIASDVDAVVLATPVSTHFALGKRALEHDKHLLIEKPMAASVAECEELVNLAAKRKLTLMVDHTFVFTGAVRKIEEIVRKDLVGDVYYFDSVRVNLGLFQHDVNVLWDLAPHDLAIMDFILRRKPTAVSAVGVHHINGIEDVVYVAVHFDSQLIAHFHVNWLAPVKIRRILIGGSKQMVVYDDMEPSEKVRVYDKGVEVDTQEGIYSTLVQYRTGDMYAPKLDSTEALSLMADEFVKAIEMKRPPITDGEVGLSVVRVLEAADFSLKNGGKVVKLS
ncbi:MAG: Gfo/Idh/MocA family oxidoreductase [Bacteroidota bacterium]|jgi:predicted dehydrogenase